MHLVAKAASAVGRGLLVFWEASDLGRFGRGGGAGGGFVPSWVGVRFVAALGEGFVGSFGGVEEEFDLVPLCYGLGVKAFLVVVALAIGQPVVLIRYRVWIVIVVGCRYLAAMRRHLIRSSCHLHFICK